MGVMFDSLLGLNFVVARFDFLVEMEVHYGGPIPVRRVETYRNEAATSRAITVWARHPGVTLTLSFYIVLSSLPIAFSRLVSKCQLPTCLNIESISKDFRYSGVRLLGSGNPKGGLALSLSERRLWCAQRT